MRKKGNIVQYSLAELRELQKKSKTDWKRLARMTPEEIERNAASDIDDFTNDPEFWKNARLVYPVPKDKISLRLDRDILEHFKKKGRGYQSLINAILKAYIVRDEKRH
jgi:uncharacterized protein (DUF4415 family)